MNNENLLSIVVPIYNSEPYLERCIKSILNQDYKNIELILIDDCSSDNSPKICKRFKSLDSRIRFHRLKENKGVSEARNFGIKISRGNFITFVDSDDYIEKNTYSLVSSYFGKVDMIIFNAMEVLNDFQKSDNLNLKKNTTLSKVDLIPDELFEIAGAVWRVIYSKEIIIKNKLFFCSELKLSEDRLFNLEYISMIKTIIYVPDAYYYRLIHSESSTKRFRKNMINETILANKMIKNSINKNWTNEYLVPYNKIFCLSYISCISNILRKENHDSFFKKITTVKHFLKSENVSSCFEKSSDKKFKIYSKKRYFLIFSIQLIELYLKECHNHFLKNSFGKLLSILYKISFK